MLTYEQVGNKFIVSYFDEQGQNKTIGFKIPSSELYAWETCKPDDPERDRMLRSQNGQPIKKVYRRYLDRYRTLEFLMSLDPASKAKIFSANSPQKWFMDIETEIVSDRPDANNPMGKVLTNAFCNQDGRLYLQGLQKLSYEQLVRLQDRINGHFAAAGLKTNWRLMYRAYESEAQLLQDLMHVWVPQMPMVAGWNFLKFDWNYLMNRCERIGISTDKTSPTGSTYTLALKDKYNKTQKDMVKVPMHRAVIDYMMVWEKWDTYVKYKSGAGLDFVAKEVLGVEKVHSQYSLDQLYAKDYETFLFYNAIDTCLVAMIDEKLQTFRTMEVLAREGRVQLHDAPFASVLIENLFYENLHGKGVRFVRNKDQPEASSYTGGYVQEPVTGRHMEVAIADFVSHYPSTTSAFNIGNDTLVGRFEVQTPDLSEEQKAEILAKDAEHNRAPTVFPPYQSEIPVGTPCVRLRSGRLVPLDGEKHICCESGVVYDKTKESSMRVVISQLFGQRVEAKYAGADIDAEIEKLKALRKVPLAGKMEKPQAAAQPTLVVVSDGPGRGGRY